MLRSWKSSKKNWLANAGSFKRSWRRRRTWSGKRRDKASSLLDSALPQVEIIQGDNHKRVLDSSLGNEAGNICGRHESGDDVLPVVEVHGVFQSAILHQHGVARVALDGRVGENFAQNSRILAFVAGLLAQFPRTGDRRRSILTVHHPAGDFQIHGVPAMPILLYHHQKVVRSHGDDVDPVHAVDDKELVLVAGARGDGAVGPQSENAEVTERFGA